MKIKKGDTIIVRTGKDRGKTGTVLRALPKKGQLLVEDINIVSKHQRSTKRGQAGQIVKRPMPLPASNVALLDPKSKKPTRIGYRTEGEGEKRTKVRIARASGEEV